MDVINPIVLDWIKEFTERIRTISQSHKINFTYEDAVSRSQRVRTQFDGVMIAYLKFINSNPLAQNDYFKYVHSYREGKELNLKYFKHNVEKLKGYYAKVNAEKDGYNPFNIEAYKTYVLFMMLKLEGVYEERFNPAFHVQVKDHREYTPLSKIPSVLRGELPYRVKEYDIARAYPTFIDNELGINDRTKDVYDLIGKVEFNTLLHIHNEVKGARIEEVRERLKIIYNGRTREVITEERFNNRGRMYRDLVIYEEKAINKFIEANKIKNFVRLHDGVFVKADCEAEILEFGKVRFVVKECVKPLIMNERKNFYTYDQEGKLCTSPKQYADYFQQEKFIRGNEEGNDHVIIFKDTNNVVSQFNHKTETVEFLKGEINELHTDDIENRIARDNQNAISGSFLLLPSKPIRYYADTKDSFGLPFKNGFFKYDHVKKKIECIDYRAVDGFFASHRTQEHEFKEIDFKEDGYSEFELFLTMACTGKDPRNERLTKGAETTLNNFCSMFGYLCHTYKDQSFSPAIILSDEGANDLSRNGGRGKTLLTKAASFVQPSMIKGGKEFDPSYIHNFADLDKSRRLYILDDVPAGFRYDDLYTNIVGNISCQRKGKPAQEIPFEQTPKFLITTNWAVKYNQEDTSTNRRFMEYKFTSFFNIENKPTDIFGHSLFQEWDNKEWNRFYNFVFYCVGLFMAEGLRRIEYDKAEDNFRAYFSNDAKLDEFERIINILMSYKEGFTVGSFLKVYKHYDNPLKHEKLFSKNNAKELINAYLKKNNLNFKYVKNSRTWVSDGGKLNSDKDDLVYF